MESAKKGEHAPGSRARHSARAPQARKRSREPARRTAASQPPPTFPALGVLHQRRTSGAGYLRRGAPARLDFFLGHAILVHRAPGRWLAVRSPSRVTLFTATAPRSVVTCYCGTKLCTTVQDIRIPTRPYSICNLLAKTQVLLQLPLSRSQQPLRTAALAGRTPSPKSKRKGVESAVSASR